MPITQICNGTVKYTAGRIITTQYGERVNVVIALPDGQEVKLWGKPDDLSLRSLARNQSVQILHDGKGWKLIETPTTPQTSNGHQPTPTHTPWTQEEREVLKAKVADHAALLKHCLVVARSEFGELLESEDCIFKAAVTLYIAARDKR